MKDNKRVKMRMPVEDITELENIRREQGLNDFNEVIQFLLNKYDEKKIVDRNEVLIDLIN